MIAMVTSHQRVYERRDEIPRALEREQVHRGAAPLAAVGRAYVQDPAAQDADPEAGRRGHRAVKQAEYHAAGRAGRDHVTALGAACGFWTDRHRMLLWLDVSTALYIEQYAQGNPNCQDQCSCY